VLVMDFFRCDNRLSSVFLHFCESFLGPQQEHRQGTVVIVCLSSANEEKSRWG